MYYINGRCSARADFVNQRRGNRPAVIFFERNDFFGRVHRRRRADRRGSSYANRGKHYVRGHYSRDDGASYRGGRGRYSRDGGKEEMVSQLEMMMEDASSDRERQAIRRCIEQLENG